MTCQEEEGSDESDVLYSVRWRVVPDLKAAVRLFRLQLGERLDMFVVWPFPTLPQVSSAMKFGLA